MQSFQNSESREVLDFDLSVIITRHGPKQGLDGPLSEKGIKETQEYFSTEYERILINVGRKRRIIASPKVRAIQTAEIYQSILLTHSDAEPVEVEIEESLNEGDIMTFYNTLTTEEQKNWFQYWYNGSRELPSNAPVFKRVLRDFSLWLLKEINTIKTIGGNIDIDAFSHAPLMGAVLLSLEDELCCNIITDLNNGDRRIDREELFDLYSGKLRALQSMYFHITSDHADILMLYFLGKKISIPISLFEKFAKFVN